ncbi:MAG: sugar ABC transporter ATP-binding protein [Thermoleophilia bacterium]
MAFRAIDKRFPGVHAVRSVDLDVGVGRIHGLVGENGAGKSTLVKLLTGVHLPDAGTIDVLGARLRAGDPVASRRAGVAAVYQETTIVPRLSPVANVFLGQDIRRLGMLSERAMAQRFAELRELVGVQLPETGPAGALSVGAQKAIEILRALQQGARVIVMDEPTAVMPPAERDAFYATARLLRDQGAAIVFISHNLDEVLDLCDAVTVMRDGERVLTRPAAELDRAALVEAMLGRALETTVARPPADDRVGAAPVLRVRGLSLPGRLHGVDLDVRPGELLGVAGLVGAGRTSLLRSLSGLEPDASGAIEVAGEPRRWPRSPHESLKLGIALAPEDRRTQGLVLSLSAAENVVLPSLRRDALQGFISRARAYAPRQTYAHR